MEVLQGNQVQSAVAQVLDYFNQGASQKTE